MRLYAVRDSQTSVVQVSLVQIDDYGRWTVTPSPRRETDLQALQARLYADFADFVGSRDGYAFFGRFDNMIGVTNGIGLEAHERFQERVRNQYPVTVSIGIGAASTPVAALARASTSLQDGGSAQDPNRREILTHDWANDDLATEGVTIAHFDMIDVTRTFTDRRNAIDTDLAVRRATLELATYLRDEHDSIAQFVGGDNVIAVCPRLDADAFNAATDHVRKRTGIDLQVGIGYGRTAYAAGTKAKSALEDCREKGMRISGGTELWADD
jgi:GTP cyclohydrolase IIa